MTDTVLLRMPCGLCTWIDAEDLERVIPYTWTSRLAGGRRNHYAQGSVGGGQSIAMHRWLMGSPPGLVIDHVNGDGLDNRRSANLRAVTALENARNRHTGLPLLSQGILPAGVPIVDGRIGRAGHGAGQARNSTPHKVLARAWGMRP